MGGPTLLGGTDGEPIARPCHTKARPSFTTSPTEVAVPSNGQVAIAANFTASEQFVLYYDATDSTFQGYSGQVTIG